MLVQALELGGLELGGERNSLDVEIIQLLRLVPLLWSPSWCQATRLGINARKEPSNLCMCPPVPAFPPICHHSQEPVELCVPFGGTGFRSGSVYSAG